MKIPFQNLVGLLCKERNFRRLHFSYFRAGVFNQIVFSHTAGAYYTDLPENILLENV